VDVSTDDAEPARWDGNADTANELLGESYGVDWCYAAKGSSAIVVPTPDGPRRVEVGELLEF
jgi:hypothetical protein